MTRTRAQYTAIRFTQRLADAGIAPSTGSVGDSYDNALAENLWSTIKIELLYWPGTSFATRAEAEAALFRYIDGWYNPRRIQRGLSGLSPDEYEQAHHTLHQQPAQPATLQPEPANHR
ncbi:IS3 family transposase [Pseudonocardia eucalypti]|uniref:IS3 family transposase n=1 Tax=Pseudonocardia eucalypti TaxID=648755 RepID=UPI0031E7DDDC